MEEGLGSVPLHPEVEPLGGLPVTPGGAKSSPGVEFPRLVSAQPPDPEGAGVINDVVLPILGPPDEEAHSLSAVTELNPQAAGSPDVFVQDAVKAYASSVQEEERGEPPTAVDSYAIMRTRQGQNAVAAAAGQPLLHPPTVAISVIVNGERYNVEVSQEGTFLSGPGLLDSSGEINPDTLADVLEGVKRKAIDTPSSLGQWASDQVRALTADNPSAIPPEEVDLAERAAQGETMRFASFLERTLNSENLGELVEQLRAANKSEQVYRDIFSSSSPEQKYDPNAYTQEVRQGLTQNFSSFVRGSLSAVQKESGREIELEERVSASVPPICRRVRTAVDPALDALTSEDSHDSVELRPKAGPVGEKDRALGFNKTRDACAFAEPWRVGKKVVAQETIQIIETRQRAEAGIKKAQQELEGRTDDVSNHRCRALEKMRKTLNRDQSFLHATGLREIVERATQTGSPSIDEIAFAEPPDLVKDTVIVGETGEKFDVIRVGAFSDHLNSVVSLKLLNEAEHGNPEALAKIDETRSLLEERLKTEKLTDPQRVVLKHMIDQLQKGNLSKTLAERREILKQQALQLVATQVEEAGSQLRGMDRLHVAHTSLLYPGKSSWDKSGIGHVEQRMIEDMEQVFSEINRQEIHLDEGLESPFIDADGFIHVPRPKDVDKSTITLATHYVNASATHKLSGPIAAGQSKLARETIRELSDDIILQGRTLELQIAQAKHDMVDGTPEQVEAAKQGLPELQGKLSNLLRALSLVKEVKEELKGTTTYNTAAKLVEAQKLAGWYASTGCYSDKDRGGLAGRTVLTNMAAHSMQDKAATLDEKATHATGQEAKQLKKEANLLRVQARKLMEENPYAAFSPDSCQMRTIQHVVKRPQRFLKAWLRMRQAGKIAGVCVPLLARARWEKVLEAARKVRSRLGIRGSAVESPQEDDW